MNTTRFVLTALLFLVPCALSCTQSRLSPAELAGDLDSLYAANAAHLALREASREHQVEVRYGGALRFEDAGLEPANRPDLWMISSHSGISRGRIRELGLRLFDTRLVPANASDQSHALFTYRGRFYAFEVSKVARGRRADEVLPEMGISPLDFVKEAAKLVSDDKKSSQKSLSAPG